MRILFFTYTYEHVGFDPIGIMTMSSILKAAGHETRLVLRPRDRAAVNKDIEEFKPDILAYSVATGIHRYFHELNESIRKDYNAFSIFGGPHPTFFPEFATKNLVDAIGIGECDYAMLDLVNALRDGAPICGIPNIASKSASGELRKNPPRPLVNDLDTIPFPDRDLARRRNLEDSHGLISFTAGRGCPYNCTYCFNHAFRKLYGTGSPGVRFRSVPNLIAEAKIAKEKYRPRFAIFTDDCLILNQKWLEEFSEAWPSEVGLPFACNGRFNLHNETTIPLLRAAGCKTIYASIETGNDYLRNELLKKHISKEQIIEGASIVRENGIALLTQTIFGLPRSTLKTEMETLALAVACKPSNAASAAFMPYPQTELGDLAIKDGLCSSDPDLLSENVFVSSTFLKLPDAKYQSRLHSIFGLAVEFKVIRILLPVLLCLPIEKPGFFLSRLWKGYCARYRLYPQLKYSPLQTARYALKFVFGRSA